VGLWVAGLGGKFLALRSVGFDACRSFYDARVPCDDHDHFHFQSFVTGRAGSAGACTRYCVYIRTCNIICIYKCISLQLA
jgi:hypothetical protein